MKNLNKIIPIGLLTAIIGLPVCVFSQSSWTQVLSPAAADDHYFYSAHNTNNGMTRRIMESHGNTLLAPAFTFETTGRDSIGIFRSTDNGNTWQPSFMYIPNSSSDLTRLLGNYNDSLIFIVRWDQRRIFRSADQGLTWSDLGPYGLRHEAIFNKGQTLMMTNTTSGGGNAVAFSISHDFGTTWINKSQDLPTSKNWVDYAVLEDTIYLLSRGEGIYASSDMGDTWNRVGSGQIRPVRMVKGGNNRLIASIGNTIRHSDDGGHTWVTVPGADYDGNAVRWFTYASGVVFAATSKGLYYSTDNGNSWAVDDTTGLGSPGLGTVHVHGNTVFVSRTAQNPRTTPIFKKNLSDITGTVNLTELAPKQMIVMYPNPAQDYLNLKGVSMNSEIRIFDVFGKTLIQKNATSEDLLQIDLAKLPKGIYFIHVKNGDRSWSERLIITRP